MIDDLSGDMIYEYINEACGICTELMPITKDILSIVQPYVENHIEKVIYTGYNWSFDKQAFIKLNSKNEEYPLYIKIHKFNTNGRTGRNINAEKRNDTTITIEISVNCKLNNLESVIIHELRHCREFYTKENENILADNKRNIYGSPYLPENIKNIQKHVIYYF